MAFASARISAGESVDREALSKRQRRSIDAVSVRHLDSGLEVLSKRDSWKGRTVHQKTNDEQRTTNGFVGAPIEQSSKDSGAGNGAGDLNRPWLGFGDVVVRARLTSFLYP